MKAPSVLLVHNPYQQYGGEDSVVAAERRLLRAAGHRVIEFSRDNKEIPTYGLARRATLPLRTVWAWDSARELRAVIAREKPQVAHFHNTFPLISPAAYYVCHEAGIPVVQTLHNYRLLCPVATLFRQGEVCRECVDHSLWRSVKHGCYRDSRPATAAVALMLAVHRWLGTWQRYVDCYIALTEFARQTFLAWGLPAERVVVKPNFVYPPIDVRDKSKGHGDYALFVGRLSTEKGLSTLLSAWKLLGRSIPLRVVGDGPMRAELETRAREAGLDQVHFTGRLAPDETVAAIQETRFLLFPSECYEAFGRTITEAFACGTPVICTKLGSMNEIIQDGQTGLHFSPKDPVDLARKVSWAWGHPEQLAQMGIRARQVYSELFSPEPSYRTLLSIYERVTRTARPQTHTAPVPEPTL